MGLCVKTDWLFPRDEGNSGSGQRVKGNTEVPQRMSDAPRSSSRLNGEYRLKERLSDSGSKKGEPTKPLSWPLAALNSAQN
jgi:hypothetical protein